MINKKQILLILMTPFVLATGIIVLWYMQAFRTTEFTPVDFFWDIHAIALDPNDESLLYVATHLGLVRGVNEADWSRVGPDQSDFMGFSIHPNRSDVMYSSGHPQIGQPPRSGRLGLRRSTNRGQSWETIAFDGIKDLHSIAISPAQWGRIYAWDGEVLLRSDDDGASWVQLDADGLDIADSRFEDGVNSLSPDPNNPMVIWAATNKGLFVSQDAGESWRPSLPFLEQDVAALEITPQIKLIYTAQNQLWITSGKSESWEQVAHDLQERIIDFSISEDGSKWYAASASVIYRSGDQGRSWKAVRDIGTPQ